MADTPIPKWQSTRLWKELERREGDDCDRLLRGIGGALEKAEDILDKADTAPGTFTLHDADHSRRVAEMIAGLAGDSLLRQMSQFDLSLLLLSAYLHDIGMTAAEDTLDAILSYLLSGEPQQLSASEVEALQSWLDEEAAGLEPPVAEGPATLAVLRRARSLAAGYARHRHVDWSEAWILENLLDLDGSSYKGFTSDLVLLCRSHQLSIDSLRDDDFDPRLVGAPSSVLHLRCNACLLRIADILDFDPERTPAIIYAHRAIDGSSEIFWHKDHEIAFALEDSRILIFARPSSALVHRAIDLTVQDIDHELAVCQRLAEETQFHRMTGQLEDLPHRWRLEPRVHADIKPRNDAYVYVDGTFRPDQERVLGLLGGVALYGNKFAAVRELLQNAFDAVREQIAYERLEREARGVETAAEQVAGNFSVSLTLERRENSLVLICKDSGSGMSQGIITSRFLVSGSSPSHATRNLERACAEKGFAVGRTARFGIGVLAYFLLTEELTIHTRRSMQSKDPDIQGWTFISHGLSDFGELKENRHCAQGTTIELPIREELLSDGPDAFARGLGQYLLQVLKYVPCHFSFQAPGLDVNPILRAPGWVLESVGLEKQLLAAMTSNRQLDDPELDLVPRDRRREMEQRHQRWERIRADAAERLELIFAEGDLPHGLGRYRHTAGCFRIDGAIVFPYVDLIEDGQGNQVVRTIEDSHAVELASAFITSWNGMHVQIKGPENEPFAHPAQDEVSGLVTEVDFTSDAAGELAVHRGMVTLSEKAIDALAEVRKSRRCLQRELLHQHAGSPLALINARTIQTSFEPQAEVLWPEQGTPTGGDWPDQVRLLPLALPGMDLPESVGNGSELRWREHEARRIPPMIIRGDGRSARPWHGAESSPEAITVIREDERFTLAPVWTSLRLPDSQHLTAEFPVEWSSLVGIEVSPPSDEYVRVWNPSHPILKTVDGEALDWVAGLGLDSFSPLLHEKELLASPAKMAAWILACIAREEEDIWNGVAERSPEFFLAAWESIDGIGDVLFDWYEDGRSSMFGILSPESWESFTEPLAQERFRDCLGDPPDDWVLRSPAG